MLSSKLDAVAMEYNQLLTSQLESQRQYFEGLIAAARLDADKARLDMDRCGMTDASAAACAPQLGWPDAHTACLQRPYDMRGCRGARREC